MDRKYLEEHIKATASMMGRLDKQSTACKENAKIAFRRLVVDAANILGVSDVDGWLRELGVADCA